MELLTVTDNCPSTSTITTLPIPTSFTSTPSLCLVRTRSEEEHTINLLTPTTSLASPILASFSGLNAASEFGQLHKHSFKPQSETIFCLNPSLENIIPLPPSNRQQSRIKRKSVPMSLFPSPLPSDHPSTHPYSHSYTRPLSTSTTSSTSSTGSDEGHPGSTGLTFNGDNSSKDDEVLRTPVHVRADRIALPTQKVQEGRSGERSEEQEQEQETMVVDLSLPDEETLPDQTIGSLNASKTSRPAPIHLPTSYSSSLASNPNSPSLPASPVQPTSTSALASPVFGTPLLGKNNQSSLTLMSSRRLSRKQAPILTESLENLSLSRVKTEELESNYPSSSTAPISIPSRPAEKKEDAIPDSPSRYMTTSARQRARQSQSPFSADSSSPRSDADVIRARRKSLFGSLVEAVRDGTASSPVSERRKSLGKLGLGLGLTDTLGKEKIGAPIMLGEPIGLTPTKVEVKMEKTTPTKPLGPKIPPRIGSLPIPLDSQAAKLARPPVVKASHPFDHFLYPSNQERPEHSDVRRPSDQTFMTGYSLGGGPDPGTTDDEHRLTPPIEKGPQALFTTIPSELGGRMGSPSGSPQLNGSVSRFVREEMPFGRSRSSRSISIKQRAEPGFFGNAPYMSTGGSGSSTPIVQDVSPSKTNQVNLATAPAVRSQPEFLKAHSRSQSRNSGNTITPTPRRPVQWAELDALEEEEARARAEQRKEDKAVRKEAKAEKERERKVKRMFGPDRTTKKKDTGYSTDTSSDGATTKGLREGYRARKARIKREAELFDANVNVIPSQDELIKASTITVRDETGKKIEFGRLVSGSEEKQYVVVFIRHWYCPLCAQYMESIIRSIDQEALDRARVELIVIGNGSYKMLPGYTKAIGCPFRMYTDSKLKLYRALGMSRQTGDAGAEEDKGDYIKLTMMEGTWGVAKRATKMPLRNPGAFTQIGGEFIFKSPTQCTYAHRMSNTRNHAPIRDIVALAGVQLDFIHVERGPSPPAVHRNESAGEGLVFGNWGESGVEMSAAERYALETRRESDGNGWMVEKELELERIRNARDERRGSLARSGKIACSQDILSDSEAEPEVIIHSRFVEMIETPTATTIAEESIIGQEPDTPVVEVTPL